MSAIKDLMDHYYTTYSTGDYSTVPFSEDVVFESLFGKVEGREAVVKHLDEAHAMGAVKEKLVPFNMLIDGDKVAVELMGELAFDIDIPDFPFGTAKKGTAISVRFGAFYETKDNQISRVAVHRF
ncbi:MAG: nuclear transport factor 2 family protein [Spirochaetales bacterium]|nr:nuclear transport factor 2 family protein [Spirochaetales bacterium]